MVESLKIVQFKSGDHLFHENEESYHFYIVQSGQVEVYKKDEHGARLPLAIIEAGQPLGELAMIDRKPRSASAMALNSVSAVLVPEAAYRQLLNELPVWAKSVMQALVERLRKANEVIRQQGALNPALVNQITASEFDPDITATEIDLDGFKTSK